ncbi:hypothetical protein J3Q64DRAFT_1316301 [Phycomyces blakesleeanus]|uniref:CsbD-like domain-containing protein n=1 Tax=Phycomyces blakesleeanus TaxID=4837 RepID=A0ABR3B5U9_PHYBL
MKRRASSESGRLKSDIENTAERASTRAKEEAGVLGSTWQHVKETVKSEVDHLKHATHSAKEDAERYTENGELRAREAVNRGESKVQNGLTGVKDKVGEWVSGSVDGAENTVDGAISKTKRKVENFADDAKSTLSEHVRRGEGWAEEEADNLRPTRKSTMSSERSADALQKEHYKPAEEVVEEARSSKL